MKFYAKTTNINGKTILDNEEPETIKQHTDNLLKELEILEKEYGKELEQNNKINWKNIKRLLEYAVMYHDIGKVYTPFQNLILERVGRKTIKTKFNYTDIKHEQISPLFVPIRKLELSEEERSMLIQAIYYHHERKYKELDKNLIKMIIEEDLRPRLDEIKNEMNIEIDDKLNILNLKGLSEAQRIGKDKPYLNTFRMLKGLLHKLDHSASAHIDVENGANIPMQECTLEMMKKNGYSLNNLQEFCLANQDDNVVIIGSTGIGKTEGALLWSGNSKLFFTLPLRISINAIYDRIRNEINYREVGLLHSTAIDYMENALGNEEFNTVLDIYEQSKNLSMKITTCTIDQLFPFVFMYKGYEKVLATLAYSKVVIDEIQAYSPYIVAVLLKGIEMIHSMGGKFMIMTATLPRIYKERLEKKGIVVKTQTFIKYDNNGNELKRHKIKMHNESILNAKNEIINEGKSKKVLIIVNTVNRAIELYKLLEDENAKLLHSRFIQQDRANLEKEIKEFSNTQNSYGIWITTQLVEASIDIDFDILYTEMSTLDSLFQRLGRCYRNRTYNRNEPNVNIYTDDISGVNSGKRSIYDYQLVDMSIKMLQDEDETILEENKKIELVDKLYSEDNLKDTKFFKTFEKSMEILDNIQPYEVMKDEAQDMLRDIQTITVIPQRIYDENIDLIEKFIECKNYKEKSELKRKIEMLTTAINKSQCKYLRNTITLSRIENTDIFIISGLKYDKSMGLILKADEEYNLDERIL